MINLIENRESLLAEITAPNVANWNGKEVCSISQEHGKGVVAGSFVDTVCDALSAVYKVAGVFFVYTVMVTGAILHYSNSHYYHQPVLPVLAIGAAIAVPLTIA